MNIKNIEMCDELDSYEEISIIVDGTGLADINKSDAAKIINHLSSVFKLDSEVRHTFSLDCFCSPEAVNGALIHKD